MVYRVLLKHIDFVDVNAVDEESALNIVRSRLNPKDLVEMQVVESCLTTSITNNDTREDN